ncbi:helix-turn-helix domain-containing protein [Paenibacillus senegalensis]|uniref:helix-turn-helix domain-containing protein n=1 Tax=Paenibacillus senegalensis TaxID=1465766 RepID=UPI000288D569|nr:helix-turn-helix domain-containing protein [Paenibacillus senegalensis]
MRGRAGKRDSLYIRLLVFNLILVLLITVIPSVVYFQFFNSGYNEQLQRLNMQAVTQLRSSIDEEVLKDAVELPNRYLSSISGNEELTFPLSNDISRDSARILGVSRAIGILEHSLPYVDSIDIYYRESKLIFFNTKVCFLPNDDCELGHRAEWFPSFDENDEIIRWLSTRDGDERPIITYIRSIPYFPRPGGKQGIVAVNLSEPAINQFIRQLPFAEGRQLIIATEDGQLLTDSLGALEFSNEAEEQEFQQTLLRPGAEDGMFQAHINGKKSVVSFASSNYNPWIYISIASAEDYYRQSYELRKLLLLIGAVLLLVNLAFGILLTRKAHKPIGSLFRQYSTEIDELKVKLDKNKPVLRHSFLSRLMEGRVDQDTFADNIQLLDMDFSGEKGVSFILELADRSSAQHTRQQLRLYHLLEELDQLAQGCRIHAIKEEETRLSGMILLQGSSLRQVLDEFLRKADALLAGNYRLALGRVYTLGPAKLAVSYREALESLDYAFVFEKRLYLAEDLLSESRAGDIRLPKLLTDMEAAIRSGNSQRYLQAASELAAEMRTGGYTVEACRRAVQEVVQEMNRAWKTLGLSAKQLLGYDIREYGHELESLDEFVQWFGDTLRAALDHLSAKRQTGEKDMETKLRQFIEDNLDHTLSLERLAEHVQVNPNYLSKLFKAMMGMTFTDYVTGRKLQKAEELLLEQKLSVQEISSQLGYNSTHHFIRLFKERYGLTPKQYQKLNASSAPRKRQS